MDQVRLPDLEVIRRFSIAVRREHAPVEEVIEALRADLEAVTRAQRDSTQRGSTQGGSARPSRATAASKAPSRSAGRKPARAKGRR